MSLRRLFGVFIPGIVWLFVLYVTLGYEHSEWLDGSGSSEAPAIRLIRPLLDSTLLLTIALFVSCYVIGAINMQFAFRVFRMLGEAIDVTVIAISIRWHAFRTFVAMVSRWCHVLDLTRLDDEREQGCPLSAEELRRYRGLASPVEICKMRIVAAAPSLAKEVLEVEAEINYHAGMGPPMLALGLWLYDRSALAGILVVGLAIVHILRFQHLCHYEVEVTYVAHQAMVDLVALPVQGAKARKDQTPEQTGGSSDLERRGRGFTRSSKPLR